MFQYKQFLFSNLTDISIPARTNWTKRDNHCKSRIKISMLNIYKTTGRILIKRRQNDAYLLVIGATTGPLEPKIPEFREFCTEKRAKSSKIFVPKLGIYETLNIRNKYFFFFIKPWSNNLIRNNWRHHGCPRKI